ncbi:MAG: hypothetical protein ACK5LJ_11840, partial [Paracoccus sp. (in: a-proteobacteria)]
DLIRRSPYRPAAPGSAAHKGLKEDRHRSHDQMVRKLLHTGRQPKKPVVLTRPKIFALRRPAFADVAVQIAGVALALVLCR